MLVLSNRLPAGLRALNAHDVPSLKTAIDQVAIKVDNDPDVFQNFYQFAFKFCLTVRQLGELPALALFTATRLDFPAERSPILSILSSAASCILWNTLSGAYSLQVKQVPASMMS